MLGEGAAGRKRCFVLPRDSGICHGSVPKLRSPPVCWALPCLHRNGEVIPAGQTGLLPVLHHETTSSQEAAVQYGKFILYIVSPPLGLAVPPPQADAYK